MKKINTFPKHQEISYFSSKKQFINENSKRTTYLNQKEVLSHLESRRDRSVEHSSSHIKHKIGINNDSIMQTHKMLRKTLSFNKDNHNANKQNESNENKKNRRRFSSYKDIANKKKDYIQKMSCKKKITNKKQNEKISKLKKSNSDIVVNLSKKNKVQKNTIVNNKQCLSNVILPSNFIKEDHKQIDLNKDKQNDIIEEEETNKEENLIKTQIQNQSLRGSKIINNNGHLEENREIDKEDLNSKKLSNGINCNNNNNLKQPPMKNEQYKQELLLKENLKYQKSPICKNKVYKAINETFDYINNKKPSIFYQNNNAYSDNKIIINKAKDYLRSHSHTRIDNKIDINSEFYKGYIRDKKKKNSLSKNTMKILAYKDIQDMINFEKNFNKNKYSKKENKMTSFMNSSSMKKMNGYILNEDKLELLNKDYFFDTMRVNKKNLIGEMLLKVPHHEKLLSKHEHLNSIPHSLSMNFSSYIKQIPSDIYNKINNNEKNISVMPANEYSQVLSAREFFFFND